MKSRHRYNLQLWLRVEVRPMLKLQQLKLFGAIAETGSFSAAAEQVGLSQPALSKSVKDMERALGAQLLVRSPRGISLTSYGNVVARRAASIQRELEKLNDDFSWLRGEIVGELAIGVTALGASSPFARAIGSFRARHPAVRIEVREMRSDQIFDLVRNGLLDCGLLTTYGKDEPEGLEHVRLASYEVAIVRGGRHPSRMPITELAEHEWVDYEPVGSSESYLATLARDLGLATPPNVLYCSSVRFSVLLAAEVGALCHFIREAIPSFRAEIEDGRLTVLDLGCELPSMNLAFVHVDREHLSPAAREFSKIMRSTRFS
jgi:molybdate transport repressor ModE-like protein